MQKHILLSIVCIFQFFLAQAAGLDSTGVENSNGKKIIIHTVDPKESYYSIGRKYKVLPQAIMDYNGGKALKIGTVLKVPTDRSFNVTADQDIVAATNESGIIEYKVGPKETLLYLASHFNTTIDAIRKLNNITGSLLSIGQVLKIQPGTSIPVTTETNKQLTKQATGGSSMPQTSYPTLAEQDSIENIAPETRIKNDASRYGLREQTERGVATTIDDDNVDGSKMLALHRTAPIGTVIKITNPMTGKSTFSKVVGRFTENQSTKDVIIVITKAAANVIGALDKRFQVNIVYGLNSEN